MNCSCDKSFLELEFENSLELKNTLQSEVKERLNDKLNCIKISLKKNHNTWIMYSDNGLGQQECYYELRDSIDVFPRIKNVEFIEHLDISMLGIKSLPEFISNCSNLNSLDISFNSLDIEKQVQNIKKIKKLETLSIYGYEISPELLKTLEQMNNGVKVYHSKEQYMQNFK